MKSARQNPITFAAVCLSLNLLITPQAAKVIAHEHDHHHNALSAAAVQHHDSLYHLSAHWTDQHGRHLQLGDLKGRPVIISMIYGNCRTACPILVNDARQIEQKLPAPQRQQVAIVFVSFDSQNDTPEALSDYSHQLGVGSPNWYFLNGRPDDVRTLASLLGIRYREKPDGSFDHSNILTLLDNEGLIAYRLEGLQQAADPLVKKLSGLLRRQ